MLKLIALLLMVMGLSFLLNLWVNPYTTKSNTCKRPACCTDCEKKDNCCCWHNKDVCNCVTVTGKILVATSPPH